MNCCDTKRYDAVFGARRARADLKRYRKKGPARTTRLLIDALKSVGVQHQTLLDIGGGIGVIPNELLAAGAESAVQVDAAEAFVEAAREEAARQGNAGRVQFLRGDFVALAGETEAADIVTLDRVICCYPNMEQLVTTSLARARRSYGIVIPRERRLTKAVRMGINLVFRIGRNPFRFYVHSPRDIEALVTRAGFARDFVSETQIWRVVVFTRAGPTPAR
ncbi:MAG TPA: class I SAM-dependent methyltransferase [Gemmatimonadaceae bacterium]|nr:class I SAM-dependent methyltransferase [Gemmatimonadaceae bacterium]